MVLKKKLVTIAVTAALCVSAAVGVVSAANTYDSSWSFYNQNSVGYTEGRKKANDTLVYVYPQAGMTINYIVQKDDSGYVNAFLISKAIPTGTQAIMKSSAKAGDMVRIKFSNSNTSSYGYTTGVWSPDSSKIYMIY